MAENSLTTSLPHSPFSRLPTCHPTKIRAAAQKMTPLYWIHLIPIITSTVKPTQHQKHSLLLYNITSHQSVSFLFHYLQLLFAFFLLTVSTHSYVSSLDTSCIIKFTNSALTIKLQSSISQTPARSTVQ